MHYQTLLAAASVASVALAAPAPAAPAEGSFKVPRVLNTHVGAKMDGQAAIKKAFAKFGMTYTAPGSTANLSRRHATKASKELASMSLDPATEASVISLLNQLVGEMKAEQAACGNGTSNAAPKKGGKGGKGKGSGTGTGTGTGTGARPTTTGTGTGTGTGAGAGNGTAPQPPTQTGGQQGEATAKPEENGALYLTPVNIGGQTVNLDFDTGSSDLWVFDKTKTGRGFDSTKSTSFKAMTGSTFKISYGDGSTASGNVGTDVVKIGAATVNAQAVELANAVSAQFQQEQATDGLLGLAFSTLNTVTPQKQKTFFDMIQPSLSNPLFTVNLLLDGSGEYEFGTIDSSKYTGQLQYVDVDSSQGFWAFPSASFKVGGTAGTNTGTTPAIADTGTSLMLVDPSVVKAYYAQVQGAVNDAQQGGYTYPCSSKLPDFSVALGTTNQYVTIPGSAVTYQAQGQTCFGGIQSNQGQPVQIYGDILLKTQFVVFEGGAKPRLGFANSKGATAAAPAGAAPAAGN